MYENILSNSANFCIGPQIGTYCYVDTISNPVVMQVKAESGNLLRTYSFYPTNILNSEPYVYDAVESDGYFRSEVVELKYIGNINTSSYFNGAVFYTLEKRAKIKRNYYTYERSDGEFVRKSGESTILAKNCIKESGVITLVKSKDIHLRFLETLKIGDEVLLGPSSESSCIGKTERVFIKSINSANIGITVLKDSTYLGPQYNYNSEDKFTKLGDLITAERVEYCSNIIRKWVLDASNFRLVLEKTIVKDSDKDDWFDANSFSVQNIDTVLDGHVSKGLGRIELPTVVSGINKYDTIRLGPSTDMDNFGFIENVYVQYVDGNVIYINSYEGYVPPKYDYIKNDGVLFLKDIFLFSNAAPVINDLEIAYAYKSNTGTLYRLDQSSYGDIIDTQYSGMYRNVQAAEWNNSLSTLSFVKGVNLLHLDINGYSIKRSQILNLMSPTDNFIITVYAVCFNNTSVYKLQKEILKKDNDGIYTIVRWSSYNFQVESMVPHAYSVTAHLDKLILVRSNVVYINLVIRDQFNVALLNRNVWCSKSSTIGDIDGLITPSDGYLTTDENGECIFRYSAGYSYEGMTYLFIKVDGGNISYGSEFINTVVSIPQLVNFSGTLSIGTNANISNSTEVATKSALYNNVSFVLKEALIFPNPFDYVPSDHYSDLPWINYVKGVTATYDIQVFPVGVLRTMWAGHLHQDLNIDDRSIASLEIYNVYLLLCSKNPTSQYSGDTSNRLGLCIEHLSTVSSNSNSLPISNNYISRHLLTGHVDSVVINQFTFTIETRPVMWSDKNNVDTDYWIRLRPFATDLNPYSLRIKFKEVTYLGVGSWYYVTPFGTTTTFDAGGGLQGIDFNFTPTRNFLHGSVVYVEVEVYDSSLVPNQILISYWFKCIQDFKAPHIINHNPGINAVDVSITKTITFDLVDIGEGVDIDTLELLVNNRVVPFIYEEYEHGNYHISCKPPFDFTYSQEVTIVVDVKDRSKFKNRLYDGWSFYCVDSTGPWFDLNNAVPMVCQDGFTYSQDVNLQVYGINNTGIDKESIKLEVGGKYRSFILTPIVYRVA